MLISIIVPVYNVEKFINKCIDSLINQDYKNIEIILVNDGSTDNSGFICDEYSKKDSRIKVIHKENGGLSSARNRGIIESKGEYIVFIDSDDFWLKNKLSNMMSIIKEKNLDVLLFKGYSYYESLDIYEPFSKEYPEDIFNNKGKTVLTSILEKDYDFGWCAVFYIISRDLIINNEIFFPEGYLCEDVSFTFKIWNLCNKIGYYNDFVYAYRRENNNSITHIASFKFSNDLLEMINRNLRLIDEYEIDNKLKNLIYLNMQTLINVVLFWFGKYDRQEKHILRNKIKKLKEIYNINREYKYLIRSKERITSILIKYIGIYTTGYMWNIKNKYNKI